MQPGWNWAPPTPDPCSSSYRRWALDPPINCNETKASLSLLCCHVDKSLIIQLAIWEGIWSHNLILPAQGFINPASVTGPFLNKVCVTQIAGKRLCKFLFVKSFAGRCWLPGCWDPFFAIPCTLLSFLFKVCAGCVTQLCAISCIACCDLAFCLPAWMTETSELEQTGCWPWDYEAVLLPHK